MNYSDSRSNKPWWEDDKPRRDSSVSKIRSSHKKKAEKTPRPDTIRMKKIGHFPLINGAHYNLAKWKQTAVIPKGSSGIGFIGIKHNSFVAFFAAIQAFEPADGATTRGGWKFFAISSSTTAVSVQIDQHGAQCFREQPRVSDWEHKDYWK